MFVDVTTPRARHWAVPLGMAVVLFILSLSTETVSLWALVSLGLGCVGVLWFVVNFIIHVSAAFRGMRRDDKEVDFRLSPNYQAELITRMNNDQLRALMRSGKVMIGVLPGKSGPVERIDGEPIFLYLAWWMLKRSTGRSICPINSFKEGTYHFDMWGDHEWDDYTQARAFTAWLCLNGMARWGIGNSSAVWEDGWNAERVMTHLGLAPDSYGVEELSE